MGSSHKEPQLLSTQLVQRELSVVQLLLAHQADVEKTYKSSSTPLLATIIGNQGSIICLLLHTGADVNERGR